MGRHDCSAFRPCAEPSHHLCGNLCSATAVLHVLQPPGCIFIIRHVRSLRFLRWVSVTGGCAPPLRLLACGAVLLVCKALPLNTKGDDAADPEESGVRASGERFSQIATSNDPNEITPALWSGDRRWRHRVLMRSPLFFVVGPTRPLYR